MPELILDCDNRRFNAIVSYIPKSVTEITASIAYNDNHVLVDQCIKNKINLEWWGLFNEGISTDLELIKKALNSPYIIFYSFTNNFHPKLIYFHGYGLFIGSHNMTRKAAFQNIECGVFFKEEELTPEQHVQLSQYFAYLRDNSKKFIKEDLLRINEYVKKTEEFEKEHKKIQNEKKEIFNNCFPELNAFVPKFKLQYEKNIEVSEKQKEFSQEWRNAQQILDVLQAELEKSPLPKFVLPNASKSIILDQFLYLYYSTNAKGKELKTEDAIEEMFIKNRNRHEEAIAEAIELWNTFIPDDECKVRINEWGFENKAILEKLKEEDLSREDFHKVFSHNNALLWSASRFPNEEIGIAKDKSMTIPEKLPLICDFLFTQKTKENLSIHDVLRYLLFEDSVGTETRVFNLIENPKYKIRHLGKSVVGELLGWGRPDVTHLRNESTNRALRCLGFDIKLS